MPTKKNYQPCNELSIFYFHLQKGLNLYLFKITFWMNETACLWKIFKWNKFHGDRLSEKMDQVDVISPDNVSERINQLEETPTIRRQVYSRY